MRTKYGVGPIGVIWPADVTLMSSRQPDAKSCSATSTERRADRATHDAELSEAVEIEGEKFGVIAGPSLMDAARAGPLEVADNIAVRVQHTDFGDDDLRQLPLPARLPQ